MLVGGFYIQSFPPRDIVYGCRSSTFLYRLWCFEVAVGGGGRQLEDIIVGLEQWESVYKWIHNHFPPQVCVSSYVRCCNTPVELCLPVPAAPSLK